MHPSLYLYNLAAGVGSLALPAFFLASALDAGLSAQRPRVGLQGHLPFTPQSERGVWLQAVSVGEVQVADNIAQSLWERGFKQNLTITSSTSQGLSYAKKTVGLKAQVLPFPLDFIWAVQNAVQRIRPRLYVSLETEIWPNLLWALYRQGAKIIMLNGRISQRSFPRYLKIRPLMAACLNMFSCLSMISQLDAQRVIALGAHPARVRVDGNAKYGLLKKRAEQSQARPELAARLNLQNRPLLVAGSVRSGEEEPVLQAFKQVLQNHDKALLLCAPRHMNRADNWLRAAQKHGFTAGLWSRLNQREPQMNVLVLDEMGRLFDFYGLASAVFVGASLVNKGGQNPLEPAAWGEPIAFGPYMEDFSDATALLLPQAAVQVDNAPQLAQFWMRCLQEPDYANNLGKQAKQVVARLDGSAGNCANLIMRYCGNETR